MKQYSSSKKNYKVINEGFSNFKEQFLIYLKQINKNTEKMTEIENKIDLILNRKKRTRILNFNYTDTIEKYCSRVDIINIHGSLKDLSENPIIFGYGDEMDPHVKELEDRNKNDLLIYLKTMSYHYNSNYERLMNFIDDHDFNVYIMGHSCGISDRLLFNSIFEHPKCKAIKIFYYDKGNGENDYYEKCIELYRHFIQGGKSKGRRIIVPFIDSEALIKSK